jgi:UDP-N-acetyl-D-glucosamine dehydrogenase
MKVNALTITSQEIQEKILSGEFVISVHGFGHVGSAITSAFLRKGGRLVVQDVKSEIVEKLNSGNWKTPDDKKITETIRKGFIEKKISATEDYKDAVSSSSFHIIAVPVIVNRNGKKVKIDLDQMIDVSKNIGKSLSKGDVISIETTLPPGTTEGLLRNVIEKESGLKAGFEFALVYSPERILVGRALDEIESNYPKVVSGFDQKSLDIGTSFYSIVSSKGVIRLSSIKAAETEKVFEGVYRDVNIALANELSDYCLKEGLNFSEIMNAANSQPYSHLHKPGVGVGGACIPVYPYFILKEIKKKLSLTCTARRANERRPFEIAVNAIKKFSTKYGYIKGLNTTILGLSFRGDVSDNRLSPTIDITKYLLRRGYYVTVHDPFKYVDTSLPRKARFTNDLKESLRNSNIVILATDHSEYKHLTLEQITNISSDKVVIEDPKQILGRT